MAALDESEDERATRGLSTVVHPMIAEAASQFNARAMQSYTHQVAQLKLQLLAIRMKSLKNKQGVFVNL